MRMQVLKTAISIVLLAGVFFLVVYYYDTSELLDDARGLSVATIGMIVIALLANTFIHLPLRLSQRKSNTRSLPAGDGHRWCRKSRR